jgi:anthranilate synthase component 1
MLIQTTPHSAILQEACPLVPVIRQLPADLETPVSVYLKLAGQGPSFLLESITGGEQLARYSFIGVQPSQAFLLRDGSLEQHSHPNQPALNQINQQRLPDGQDALDFLRSVLSAYRPQPTEGLPRFAGGLVGYLSFDLARQFEPSTHLNPHSELPEAIFLLADTLVAFDHAFGRMLLIANARLNGQVQVALDEAEARLDEIERRLNAPLPAASLPPTAHSNGHIHELRSNKTQTEFEQMVLEGKEHIAAGDIFQVVLSQRLSRRTSATPFSIYRALRRLNPSPYMYYFDFDRLAGETPLSLIGASPEMHVRLEGRTATVRPIAGTRQRGQSEEDDVRLEADLLADPKERAEHVMLIDLARNDLGRVCEYGSVHTPEVMQVEHYSHVMHIVSQVEGQLRPELDAFDLMRATFPAGTVSGAPKIRAMQIIHELEQQPRGPYAGAVGYFSYDGSMDTCITIRTLIQRGDMVSIQAGAGIVADSQPEVEYQETLNKARALAVAVEMAENRS